MELKELNKWKWLHNLLVKIRTGTILHSDKEQDKEARIKVIKQRAEVEWNEFKAKYCPNL